MHKNFLIVFIISILWIADFAAAQKTNFAVSPEVLMIDGSDPLYKDLVAGDTLSIATGNRDYLLLRNIRGVAGKPIVIINSGGQVTIDTDHYFGISIQNCQFIKFTGAGDPASKYGFQVTRVANGSGMGIGYKSSDFEIDHVSIENCPIGGIYAKTDPDCELTAVRGAFTQYNTIIHDCYIAHVGNEGLYIGSTKYLGQTVNCNGKDTLLLPSLLDGVKVYNNIIEYSGWDGIQVSSASKDCQIYNNTVLFDSQDEHANQMSGIIIGGGSKCDCYNNFIANGKGDGIEIHGLGGTRVFNNIIVNAGVDYFADDFSGPKMKYGIYVTDVSVQYDSSFYILHNDIINPKSDGIRFSSIKSKNNLIASNVIINPGNFDLYENGNTHFKGKDSYLMFPNSDSNVIVKNNFLSRNIADAGFISLIYEKASDFKLSAGSVLINSADPDGKVAFDFIGQPRPVGLIADVGAWEYNLFSTNSFDFMQSRSKIKILGNPVNDFLTIGFQDESIQQISLEIYNSNGQLILHFGNSEILIENQVIRSNVSSLSSGLYFFRLNFGDAFESGKLIKN
jgi:hypothetical protein